MRTHWRDPGFWRWWWQSRVSGEAKAALVVMAVAAIGVAGYVGGHGLAATQEDATFTQRVVTTVREVRANTSPEIVTKSQTVTDPGTPAAVTVRRAGRAVIVRVPGKTVTARGGVEQRVVTNARTDTVVRTETTTRLTTVTTPGTTQTVTREVPQPARTVTHTTTERVTVTEEVPMTETETETETVTETCTKRC